jgi:acetate kinase
MRGVRRYGFHGLAHESLWRKWCALHPQLPAGGRLITLQLGGGCSIAAIENGRPLDTSMGFSPLEGLVMATRSGDLDPAVIPYLERDFSLSAGVAGSADSPAELLASPAPEARFAVELYCYRIRKYIGAYIAVLGGCDGIVFGGGVGEHVPAVRAAALQGLDFCGARIDATLNEAARGTEARIDSGAAQIQLHVLKSDEESILAAAGAALLRSAA